MISRIVLIGSTLLTLSACSIFPQPGPAHRASDQALVSANGGKVVSTRLQANPAAASSDPRIANLTRAGFKPLTQTTAGAMMDMQNTALHKVLTGTPVTITRVGNRIALVLPADSTFKAGTAEVKSGAEAPIVAIASVLAKYNQSLVDVYGYTDNAAPDSYNRDLSQRRAVAVATILANEGVDQRRFFIEGRGSADPVGPDTTPGGRAMNRRVQIQISPLQ